MKKFTILSGTFFAIMTIAMVTQTAFSVGTPAGTVIQSRSKVVYSTASGAASDTVYSNYVSFTVAQVAAVNLSPSSNAQTTASDSVYVAYALTITNSGNGTDQFDLTSVSSKNWTRAFYFDANGDGILQSGEISAGAITQTSTIAADATYKLFVRVFVPRDGSLNRQIDTTSVTSTSVFDNSKNNTAQARTTVNTANFANIGTGLSVLPTNPSPGDNVTYTLTVNNSGSLPATDVIFTDIFNLTQFTFVGATPSGIFSLTGNTGTWNWGTIAAGGQAQIQITLQVNALPNGTQLQNTIGVTYTVGGNTFTETSNNPYAAIGVVRGVQINPTSLSAAKEPEDTLVYAMTVKNTGNAKDVLEMAVNSSQSYSWTFFKDVNNNGLLNAGDVLLTNTNSFEGVDVDSVAAADSVKILARLVVPTVPADQTQDVTTFTVKSAIDNSKFQSSIGTTTINTADVDLVRSITPTGNQPPGTEMTFTVTYQNNGHGKAYNVVMTETEPDSMTYVANSVTLGGVAKTDVADADEVTITTVSAKKVITISVGIINGQSAVGTVTYKTTIN